METTQTQMKTQLTIDSIYSEIDFIKDEYWNFGLMTKNEFDKNMRELEECLEAVRNGQTLYYIQLF